MTHPARILNLNLIWIWGYTYQSSYIFHWMEAQYLQVSSLSLAGLIPYLIYPWVRYYLPRLTYWSLRQLNEIYTSYFPANFNEWYMPSEITLRWLSPSLTDEVNIGSGYNLVLSGTKPLPEPVLTHVCGAPAHNELNRITQHDSKMHWYEQWWKRDK